MKSIDGVWTTEFHGVFGWESTGFMMFKKGRVLGGGRNHYSKGTYSQSGKKVKIEVVLDYFGEPRTLFGEKLRAFSVVFKGTLKGKRILGTATRPGEKVVPLVCRLKFRAELPK